MLMKIDSTHLEEAYHKLCKIRSTVSKIEFMNGRDSFIFMYADQSTFALDGEDSKTVREAITRTAREELKKLLTEFEACGFVLDDVDGLQVRECLVNKG